MPEKGEFIANLCSVDGAALDVGTERAIAATLNAWIDYKSSNQAPQLDDNPSFVMPNWSGEFRVLYAFPVFTGFDLSSTAVNRSLIIAPMFRSTDGSTVKVRVTVSRTLPIPKPGTNGNNWQTPQYPDLFAQNEWTTSSTTPVTGAQHSFSLGTRGPWFAHVFVIVEIDTRRCGLAGLVKCVVGPRVGEF